MIMTVEELRRYMTVTEETEVITAKLQALEMMIRRYTNNNFQQRACRCTADIENGLFTADNLSPFNIGDTVQVSESGFNEGLYTVASADESTFSVNEDVTDEKRVLVTKVVYPMDVKMGAVNLMKWELANRDKVGIASETISRHSVTYFNMDGENSTMGFPRSLLGFLKPYKKMKF